MRSRQYIVVLATGLFVLCASLSQPRLQAATIVAASCSKADVTNAYNAAKSGDVISVPAGNCATTNKWSGYLTITKSVTIAGAGAGQTLIGISGGSSGFQVQASNVRITGFSLDCGYASTSNGGIIRVGSLAGNPTYEYGNWRIDHNQFDRCGRLSGDTTGNEAITAMGYLYGVIDHNTFNDCNGECLNICADATRGTTRTMAFGQYTNGTVFVEDNVFNANRSILYENVIDGNSSQRFTFRNNTINVANGARYASGIVSTHETCVTCSGLSTVGGDAGSLVYEMYNNTINLNGSGTMRDLGIVRGGRALIYNNRITGTNMTRSRYGVASWLSNYRSMKAYGGNPTFCSSAAHPRGYSGACHEPDGSYISEGLEVGKTTAGAAITSTQTTIPLASVAGLATNGLAGGFSIKIDNEQIDYSGISGNQLTGVVRGANRTSAASHANGARVDYLKFGVCLEQPNNVRIWNNSINGVVSADMNDVFVCAQADDCVGLSGPDYTHYDIKSFTERPNNWQYQVGQLFAYTPYPYPHPLISGSRAPAPPTNVRIIR